MMVISLSACCAGLHPGFHLVTEMREEWAVMVVELLVSLSPKRVSESDSFQQKDIL